MGEMKVAGELIQMNAKMVVTQDAMECMVFGLLGAIAFVIWTIWALRGKKKAWAVIFAVLAIAEAGLFAHGVMTPRVKEIHACASGPVSLEQIAVKYDIISVDGKELTLRVR